MRPVSRSTHTGSARGAPLTVNTPGDVSKESDGLAQRGPARLSTAFVWSKIVSAVNSCIPSAARQKTKTGAPSGLRYS